MKQKGIKASFKNLGVLLDRFGKFFERNSDKTIVAKKIWGKPKKRGNWDECTLHKTHGLKPEVIKHPLLGNGIHLISVIISCFDEPHPFRVEEGDIVIVESDKIMVIPKRPFPTSPPCIRSWMITTA